MVIKTSRGKSWKTSLTVVVSPVPIVDENWGILLSASTTTTTPTIPTIELRKKVMVERTGVRLTTSATRPVARATLPSSV
jgi:hypothetical protein